VVCGLWFEVRGLWSVVSGLGSMIRVGVQGLRCTIHGLGFRDELRTATGQIERKFSGLRFGI
jgi:hypothetical protein